MLRHRAVRLQTAGLVTAALALLAGAHCGDADTTGRSRVSFAVVVGAVRAEGETATGWRVAFERAALAVGPVRWFEGEPFARRRRLLRDLGTLGVAWAHPGHYVPGEALADVTARRAVDLLAAGGVALDRADGVSGMASSAQLELSSAAGDLGGQTLVVRGTARRGERTVRFEGGLRLDRRVEGIPARGALEGHAGRWDLGVDLTAWFDQADFGALPAPTTPDGYVTVGEDSQVANALFRSATTGLPYRFSWRPAGAP